MEVGLPHVNGVSTPHEPSPSQTHTVHLSAVERCMPRAYIRVCLAYRLPEAIDRAEIASRLDSYARKLVDAKPYLAGYVVPAPDSEHRRGISEIRFTDDDFLDFPNVEIKDLAKEGGLDSYEELNERRLPPSSIPPKLVSALPEGTDDELAPAFRMQANFVRGGLIVSVYLHHCIADGTGLNHLLTGAVFTDEYVFRRNIEANGQPTPTLNARLAAFAKRKTFVRQKLSWSDHNQISDREILYKRFDDIAKSEKVPRVEGRGCVFAFDREKLKRLLSLLMTQVAGQFLSATDALRTYC
jgi:hypothetical protein